MIINTIDQRIIELSPIVPSFEPLGFKFAMLLRKEIVV